jgi:putative ABC transport system substrate-binding protein
MKRREFITRLAGTTAASVMWLSRSHAQQSAIPVIGFLGANTLPTQSQFTAAFVQRLRELGWREGRNVAIEYRWADGRAERFAEIAAEFVRLKVNVIVTSTSPPAVAAMRATSTIPIVFVGSGDPVGGGLVASLARPGGNVTGLSSMHFDIAGKRLELLRELIPGLRRIGYLFNADNPALLLEKEEIKTAGRALGLEIAVAEIRKTEDIAPAFDVLKSRTGAVVVSGESLAFINRLRINTLALGARLPTMHSAREYVESAGLISYGANVADLFRRAGDYVDKILRGANPGAIPVEQPTKFDLVINLVTAKALGLDVPPVLLTRADEVIE